MADDNSTCARCKGTAIDPEHSGTENYGDGIVRPVPEPCSACQFPEVPMRPVTNEEADDVLDRLTADNDRMLAKLNEVIDVEAGLQQVLDRAKETR
ncbi:hypothetical protein ACFW81_23855 [Streptomyces angustmyceticus]|uniref:hypothetical protein n=1 Tax=Streptomyces angustmyceticus TaxID=285578 RepID=UPI003686D96A